MDGVRRRGAMRWDHWVIRRWIGRGAWERWDREPSFLG